LAFFPIGVPGGLRGFLVNENSFSADQRLIDALLERSRPVSCGEGRILFSQGDAPIGLYLVERGEAALVMTSALGQVAMCFHAGAGSVLGLPAVLGDQPYSLTAMADKDSEIRFVDRSDFEELMRAEPNLYPYVLQVLSAEVRSARLAATDWKGQPGRDQFRTPAARAQAARTSTASSN
jgi:CRP-like cAMP-binding protein